MRYLLTIDKNGQIIEKVEIYGIDGINDVLFVKNKTIVKSKNKLKIFGFHSLILIGLSFQKQFLNKIFFQKFLIPFYLYKIKF